jgi:L-2-hydroxyglutarate oxidase LhgO
LLVNRRRQPHRVTKNESMQMKKNEFETDCLVVGAGAIGLAIARRLAMDSLDVVVVERERAIGMHTSSRSNEVIHGGLYHRPGGPQAVLCGLGREKLYDYCAQHGVEHRQIGKFVVATDNESVEWLEGVLERAKINGVPGLEMLSARSATVQEPQLVCHAALWSPRTGIIDTHGLLLAYQGDAEAHGASIALNSTMISAHRLNGRFVVDVQSTGEEQTQIHCSILINAAGIWAPSVAMTIEGMTSDRIPHIHLAKGAFLSFRGKSPFTRLIVPEPKTWRQGGIFTLDMSMQGKFGPDEAWVDTVDYGLEGWPSEHVYAAVRRYFPALPDNSLTLDYSGIRPRMNGPGGTSADWLFQGEREHGLPGLINLFGLESPGITSSLPVADVVAGMIKGHQLPFEVDPTQYGDYIPPVSPPVLVA